MTFINRIKKLSSINEVLSQVDLGNIASIKNDQQKVIDYLTKFNFEGELIDLNAMSDEKFKEMFANNKKFVAGLKHTFGLNFVEKNKSELKSYSDLLKNNSIINYKNKELDLKSLSNSEYANLLKDKVFSQTLIKHFKDKSTYRQVVLGKNEFVKDKPNKLSLKNFLLNKNKIYSLMTAINNGKFAKTVVIDFETKKPDVDINNIDKKIDIEKCNEILKKNGYEKIMYEIGVCYDKNKSMVSVSEAMRGIINKSETSQEEKDILQYTVNNIKSIYDDKYKIIFSIEPRLAVSQSTAVDWKSCMALIDDHYGLKNKASSSISAGIAVVYITKVGDKAIQRPLARFLIKVGTLSGFEDRKEDAFQQFYPERMYTSSNMSSINPPQANNFDDSGVLDKFAKRVKEIVNEINKKRIKALSSVIKDVQTKGENSTELSSTIGQKPLSKTQIEKLKNITGYLDFKMSDDYYSDSGSTFQSNISYDFIGTAEAGEQFSNGDISLLESLLSTNSMPSEYFDSLLKILVEKKIYKDLIKKITQIVKEKNSKYIVNIDYSRIDNFPEEIEAYGDKLILNAKMTGKEKIKAETNSIRYEARNIVQGRNNLKNLNGYDIIFRETNSSSVSNRFDKNTIFYYGFNGNDKGSFSIGDNFKFPPSSSIASKREEIVAKIGEGKNKKEIKIEKQKNMEFGRDFVFKPVAITKDGGPAVAKDPKNNLEVKFEKNFNRDIEYVFSDCTLKFNKEQDEENKNFKLTFTNYKNRIITYPNNYYITVSPDEPSGNKQIRINFLLLSKNIESAQLKQISSNESLREILLKNDYIIVNKETNAISFNREAIRDYSLLIDKDFTIDNVNIFKTYKFGGLGIKDLPKNIFFILDLKEGIKPYDKSELEYMEGIINICKIFNINYYVIINNNLENINSKDEFNTISFKYNTKSIAGEPGGPLKIYEKENPIDVKDIKDYIIKNNVSEINFLKLNSKSIDLSSLSHYGLQFIFSDVPNDFEIKIEKFENKLVFNSVNINSLKILCSGILNTRKMRIEISENSNINNLKVNGDNFEVLVENSKVYIDGGSTFGKNSRLRFIKSEPLLGNNITVDDFSVKEVEKFDIPKNFTARSFSANSINKVNNYENLNWEAIFNPDEDVYPQIQINAKDLSNFPIIFDKKRFEEAAPYFKDKKEIILVNTKPGRFVRFYTDSMEVMLKKILEKTGIKSADETSSLKEDAEKFEKIRRAIAPEDDRVFRDFMYRFQQKLGRIRDKAAAKRIDIREKKPLRSKARDFFRRVTGKNKKKKRKKPTNDSFLSSIHRIDSRTYFD